MEYTGTRTLTWTVALSDVSREMTSPSRLVSDGKKETSRPANADKKFSVEAFLRAKGCSHHVLTHLKRTDHGILLNGVWAYANQPVHPGDQVTIHVTEADTSGQIRPVPIPLSVIFEDEDLLVVDKPSDMPVHPSAGNYENTLANAVMYYYTQNPDKTDSCLHESDIPFVFRCITRLDRDTTGLVILAKNMLSGAMLSSMSARRQIHREYLAIVDGLLPEKGAIDAPIARQDGSALMRRIDFEHGERAITHFHRLGVFRKPTDCGDCKIDAGSYSVIPELLSLASVCLETGRTHQIRVHMKSIGHPLPGDFLYNPDSVCTLAPRQMLHSHRITFTHPITGECLTFESKQPSDMRRLLNAYNPVNKISPIKERVSHTEISR